MKGFLRFGELGFAHIAVGIAIIPFVLFADAVLGRVVFYERDILAYWVPGIEAFVRAVAEGTWPLWDPLTSFGRPMLADPSFQFAYPPTWLNLVLSPGTYYAWFVAAHCAWAGIGALRLGRAWGLGLAGAGWAGVVWMLSGPFVSLASLFHHFASASWMAWVLLALERLLERPSARSAAWLAGAAAGMALAGSADVCLMTAAAAAARVLWALAARKEGSVGPRAAWAAALLGSCALAALLAAVQWLPTLAYVAGGSRAEAGPPLRMYWSAHPANLLDVLFPGLVGEMPLGTAWRAAIFEGRGPLLRSLYVGVPAMSLALAGIGGRWRFRWLAAALAGAFVLAALGRFTPAYPALVDLPLLRLLRYPVKFLVPATLFLSLLSGAGVDSLGQESGGRRRGWTIACVIAVAVMAVCVSAAVGAPRLSAALGPHLAPAAGDVASRLRTVFARVAALAAVTAAVFALQAARGRGSPAGTATGPVPTPGLRVLAAAAALAVIDLAVAARGTVRLAPAALLRQRPLLLAAFPHPEQHRLYSFQYPVDWLNAQFTRPPAGWEPDWAWALGNTERLAPPTPTRWRLSGSFDGDFTGLTPAAVGRLIARVNGVRSDEAGLRLLRMASVTDVIAFEDSLFGLPPRAEARSVYTLPVRVFAVPDPLPRAYVVSGIRADGAPNEPSLVMASGFDERHEVALGAESGRDGSPASEDAGRAEIVARKSDRLTVSVSATRPAVLVVTESYDPGWRAWVDGTPAPVWRANAIFRGVPVPAGDHRVEMRYRPPLVAWGAAASAAGLALAGVLIGRRRA